MTKVTDPIKLEEARARMAKARASRSSKKYPQDGSLTIMDMILLGDYMPVDWTLIFKSIRQPKDVLRPVDAEAAPIDMEFSEPGDNPFADYFTEVDGA